MKQLDRKQKMWKETEWASVQRSGRPGSPKIFCELHHADDKRVNVAGFYMRALWSGEHMLSYLAQNLFSFPGACLRVQSRGNKRMAKLYSSKQRIMLSPILVSFSTLIWNAWGFCRLHVFVLNELYFAGLPIWGWVFRKKTSPHSFLEADFSTRWLVSLLAALGACSI